MCPDHQFCGVILRKFVTSLWKLVISLVIRIDGIRGDKVGVGDIGDVEGGGRVSGNTTNNCDDGRGAIWDHDRTMVKLTPGDLSDTLIEDA